MTRQSPSLSSINASAQRRNDSLKLSRSAAGSHRNDLAVLLFELMREDCLKHSLVSFVNFEDFVVRFNRTTQRRMK